MNNLWKIELETEHENNLDLELEKELDTPDVGLAQLHKGKEVAPRNFFINLFEFFRFSYCDFLTFGRISCTPILYISSLALILATLAQGTQDRARINRPS